MLVFFSLQVMNLEGSRGGREGRRSVRLVKTNIFVVF